MFLEDDDLGTIYTLPRESKTPTRRRSDTVSFFRTARIEESETVFCWNKPMLPPRTWWCMYAICRLQRRGCTALSLTCFNSSTCLRLLAHCLRRKVRHGEKSSLLNCMYSRMDPPPACR